MTEAEIKVWNHSIDGIGEINNGGDSDINYRVCSGLDAIKETGNGYKDSTLSTYGRNINKLYSDMYKAGLNMKIEDRLVSSLKDSDAVIKIIEGGTLTDRTIKNYYGLLITLTRGLDSYKDAYKAYRTNFDMIKKTLDTKQEEQKPKDKELILKDLSLGKLEKHLNIHYKKIMSSKKKDLEASTLYMLGLLHLDQVLRNEACDMVLTDKYLPIDIYPKANFIYNAGRNSKKMIIRNNKVRNPDFEGYKGPKEVKLSQKLNSAINRHIETLKNNNLYMDNKPIPLILKRLDKGGEYDKDWECSSSHYSYLMKRIWRHKGWELTSTLIRKLYAIDVRQTYKGNLLQEKVACEKLDHSKDTHDKHYVIYFD
jgi:hypothetical protein